MATRRAALRVPLQRKRVCRRRAWEEEVRRRQVASATSLLAWLPAWYGVVGIMLALQTFKCEFVL